MTERDLYESCIPMIADIAVGCRRLSGGEYQQWKRETMERCPETVKEFIGKVMIVIDSLVLAKVQGCTGATKQRFHNGKG